MAAAVATRPSAVPAPAPTAPKTSDAFPPIPENVTTGIAYLCNTDANRSVMCWYDNASTSYDGVTLPQATDPVGPTDGPVTWEGFRVAGIIMPSDSPVDFRAFVNADAQSHNFQDNVGTATLELLHSPGQPATTHFYANFSCFKDDFRVLYTDGQFGKVYSLYYCQFNNSVAETA